MPIRKNKDSGTWWVDIRLPGGQRIRRSTGTKDRKAAQEYHDRLKAEQWRVAKLGEQPDRTFEEAAEPFLKAYEGTDSYEAKVCHITHWLECFAGRELSSLTSGEIAANVPSHQVREGRKPKKLAPATQNRYVSTIKRMLSMAAEWGWIAKAPRAPRQKEAKVNIRWITQREARTLLTCIENEWMRDLTAFALATGMRASEILHLEWAHVDLARRNTWVGAERAKSSVARSVPLNDDALEVLRRRKGKHKVYAFARLETPAKQVDSRIFGIALGKARITDFTFHDLRHTWASWHAQAGTPLMVLKELGGWETMAMVQKYAHLGPSHLAEHANVVTFWSQQAPDAQKPPVMVALSA